MSDFLLVLAFYYACDQAAMTQRLADDEVRRCSIAYEVTKAHFLTEDEQAELLEARGKARAALSLKGYRRFKAWEQEHPDLVRALKAGERVAMN